MTFIRKTILGMLKTCSAQVGLFDAAVVMGPLPEGSFFALLAEHGDRIVADRDFADCYSERMGRPSEVFLSQSHRSGSELVHIGGAPVVGFGFL